jgi:hypothetical protein
MRLLSGWLDLSEETLRGLDQSQGTIVLDSLQKAARESSAAIRVCKLVVSEML